MATGINFRATAAYVTDGTGETYCRADDAYPTTRDGSTFGWDGSISASNDRDRSTSIDRRLAGLVFHGNGSTSTFRLDLPATGEYTVRVAAGDAGFTTHTTLLLKDDTTTFATLSEANVYAGEFLDATGTKRTSAAWPDNNASVTRTFGGTIFNATIGGSSGGGNSGLAHLSAVATGGGALPFIARLGAQRIGGWR